MLIIVSKRSKQAGIMQRGLVNKANLPIPRPINAATGTTTTGHVDPKIDIAFSWYVDRMKTGHQADPDALGERRITDESRRAWAHRPHSSDASGSPSA